MSGPYCPVNKVHLKTSVRVHEILFNKYHPKIHISKNGTIQSFIPYKKHTNIRNKHIETWEDIHGITETILSDVDKCVKENPECYIALVGLKNDTAMYLNTIYTPEEALYPIQLSDVY